ncbi:hypothetical protein ACG10_07595 [Azotobacter chroococcum]|nr:hypothetical protein ACG10_07595 [Azotobacter chroococcum]
MGVVMERICSTTDYLGGMGEEGKLGRRSQIVLSGSSRCVKGSTLGVRLANAYCGSAICSIDILMLTDIVSHWRLLVAGTKMPALQRGQSASLPL